MALGETNKIDAICVAQSGDVFLLLMAFPTLDGKQLLLLQEKLNAYIAFVESGEMADRFPSTRGHRVSIDLAPHKEPSVAAREVFIAATDILKSAGIGLHISVSG